MLKSHSECITFLEQIRWKGNPKCPYCESTNATPYKKERRYHCNQCFTSYSVTVGTLFHRSRVDMCKWFIAIALIIGDKEKISVRRLAKEIRVDKNTAMNIIRRINHAKQEEQDILRQIAQLKRK